MKVACKGRVSGTDGYVSKRTGTTVSQLYVDVHRIMLVVECENAEDFAEGAVVVCVGEISVFNREFKLRSASVRLAEAADNEYFAGADITSIWALQGGVPGGVGKDKGK